MTFLLKLSGMILVCILAMLTLGRRPLPYLSWLDYLWVRLARSAALSVVFVFFTALASCWLASLMRSGVLPGTHDEFSNLLAADTFAHGRLTNPPHPLWVHFESMHILQQPSCMSKYPPGQALFLALGMVLFGQPLAGVWLSTALAAAGLCWMLQAWLPPRWALLGGLLAAFAWAPTWAQSYWGGSVAALGGTLVFGSLRRIVDGDATRQCHVAGFYGVMLGLGLAVLANTRPYEGLLAGMPAALVLMAWAWRRRSGWPAVAASLLPCACVLVLAGCWMGWLNYRVTGNALTMPYTAHDRCYSAAPTFLCQRPLEKLPSYRHAVMRDFYLGWERERHLKGRTLSGYVISLGTKTWIFLKFFFVPIFVLPMLALLTRIPSRWTLFAAGTLLWVLAGMTVTTCLNPHYLAPVAGLIFALIATGLARLWRLRWQGRAVGRALVHGVFLVSLANVCMPDNLGRQDHPMPRQRARMIAELEALPGRHLVVVRYGPLHDCHAEWVYNGADIDGSRIVWARDLGPHENRPLLEYFKDRRVWLLDVDETAAPLRRYPENMSGDRLDAGPGLPEPVSNPSPR